MITLRLDGKGLLLVVLALALVLVSLWQASSVSGQVQGKVIYTFSSAIPSPNELRDALGSPTITSTAGITTDGNTTQFILYGTCSELSLSQFGKLRDQWADPLGWGRSVGVTKEGCP